MACRFNIVKNADPVDIYSALYKHSFGNGVFTVTPTPTPTPAIGTGRCWIYIKNNMVPPTDGNNNSFIFNSNELNIGSTNNYAFYGISNIIQQTGDGFSNTGGMEGVYNVIITKGTTQVSLVRLFDAAVYVKDTSLITDLYVYFGYINCPGTVTNCYVIYADTPAGGTITNIVGMIIADMGRGSTKASNVVLGTNTIPTNRWSLYNISLYNNLMAGPTINYAPNKEDEFLGDITWSVGAAGAGVKWRLTLAGAGAIAQIANARGGIVSITSTINTPSWLDEYANVGWSVQDYPVLYCRFRTLETVNTMKAVGFTDAVNGVGNLPYTTNALLITVDTSIGNFFYLTGVVAAARVNVSTTVALDANYHTFMLMPKYLPATRAFDGYELWVDGDYKCAIPAANVPIAATMMQALPAYAGNLAGAVMSTIFVDTVKFSQRRNAGTAA